MPRGGGASPYPEETKAGEARNKRAERSGASSNRHGGVSIEIRLKHHTAIIDFHHLFINFFFKLYQHYSICVQPQFLT